MKTIYTSPLIEETEIVVEKGYTTSSYTKAKATTYDEIEEINNWD